MAHSSERTRAPAVYCVRPLIVLSFLPHLSPLTLPFSLLPSCFRDRVYELAFYRSEKHHDQKQSGEEKAYFILQLPAHHEGKAFALNLT